MNKAYPKTSALVFCIILFGTGSTTTAQQKKTDDRLTAPTWNERFFDPTPAADWKDTIKAPPREGRDTFDRNPASGTDYVPEMKTPRESREARERLTRGGVHVPEFRNNPNERTPGQPLSIREQFGNWNMFWDSRRPHPDGHYYNGIYSIGRWNWTAAQAMSRLKADLNQLHPLRAVGIAGKGQAVSLGNRYVLSTGGYNRNTVRVIEDSDTSFTLLAEPGHTFQGTAKFEVLKDSSGELWLHVEGRGVPLEHPMQQRYNYAVARDLWPFMQTNAYRILSKP